MTMPADFEGRLSQGALWEAWVGAVLSRCGLYTLHHPAVVGGERDHSVSLDLEVFPFHPLQKPNVKVKRSFSPSEDGFSSEVKSSQLSFTGPDDYPMPTVLVCAQDSWMNKWPGKETVQRDFLLVSRVTGHLVWVPVGTKVQMNHPVHDRNRNYSYKCVVVNREQLRPFQDFVAKVKSG